MGGRLDSETGLYNYGARYYDPSLSIWMGVDPLADKFYSWSPYHYATNNPINIIDYDGRDTLPTSFSDIKTIGEMIFDDARDAFSELGSYVKEVFIQDAGALGESNTGEGGGSKSADKAKDISTNDPGGARSKGVGDSADKFSGVIDYFYDETMVPKRGHWDHVEEFDTKYGSLEVVPSGDTLISIDKTPIKGLDTTYNIVLKSRGVLDGAIKFKRE